jgi:flavin reductase (DIM6/NTAB) family NADH-FMN oxidoreductase RutF
MAEAPTKRRIEYTDHYPAVMKALTTSGLLLGANDAAGRPNVMTIGWGAIGAMWGRPVWIVLVRPSRHTYKCIEMSRCFTVSVPGVDLEDACRIAGSRSGREGDKFAACGLTVEPAETVRAPAVAECPLVYECAVVHSVDIAEDRLDAEIVKGAYAGGDFHRIYYGQIIATRAAADVTTRLERK